MTNDSLYMARVHADWSKGHPQSQMPMDLANETQYRFLMNRVKAAGYTAQNAPRLFERLNTQRTQALARSGQKVSALEVEQAARCGHLMPLQAVEDSDLSHFVATGYVTCFGGADYSYVDVSAYSTTPTLEQFTLLESTVAEAYGEKTLESEPLDLRLEPGMDRVLFVDSVAMAYNEATGSSVVLYNSISATAMPALVFPELTFEHPTDLIGNADQHGIIRTCLRRGAIEGALDCDYAAAHRDTTTGNTIVFPTDRTYNAVAGINRNASTAQGKWIPDSSAIWMTLKPDEQPRDGWFLPARGLFKTKLAESCTKLEVTSKVDLVLLQAGGYCTAGSASGRVVGASGSLPFKNVVSPSEAIFDGVMDFGTDCSGYQQDLFFLATATATAMCPPAPGKEPVPVSFPKTVRRSTFDFKNSCLAAGTKVQLASGALVAVEQVKVGDRVVNNHQGRALTVTSTTRGMETEPMVQLRDGKGHEVLVTRTHPMVTRSQGVVTAEKLAVGDVVLTREGEVKLTSVKHLPYSGAVYNLTLGSAQELKSVGDKEHTFYANGFLVGDNKMQTDLERQSLRQSGDKLASVHPAWRNDYLNAQARLSARR